MSKCAHFVITSKKENSRKPFNKGISGVIPLIANIHRNFYACALGVGADEGADLLGDTTLTTNDLTHILGGNAQLQRQLVAALNFGHSDLIGLLHEASGDIEQQIFHFDAALELQNVDLLQQSTDGVGGLSAGLDPLTGAVSVDLDLSGIHAGIVDADLLE